MLSSLLAGGEVVAIENALGGGCFCGVGELELSTTWE